MGRLDMTTTPRQLTLDLPHRPALAAEDFLVSACNAAAVALVDRWPDWPHPAALICGPEGAGKSHLGNVWRLRTGAAAVAAAEIGEAAVALLESHPALLVEDLDRGIADHQALFHLLNITREGKHAMLLTSRVAPVELGIALPDLSSRLKALAMVRIEAPDERLLKAMLVKLFADRQLVVDPAVVDYVALHMERSAVMAARVVEHIDALALASHRKVTRALAAEALRGLGGGEQPDR